MTKITVNINRPAPPIEVINRHKDFSKFLQGYRKYYSPAGFRYLLTRDIKKLVFIVIIAVLLLLVILNEISF